MWGKRISETLKRTLEKEMWRQKTLERTLEKEIDVKRPKRELFRKKCDVKWPVRGLLRKKCDVKRPKREILRKKCELRWPGSSRSVTHEDSSLDNNAFAITMNKKKILKCAVILYNILHCLWYLVNLLTMSLWSNLYVYCTFKFILIVQYTHYSVLRMHVFEESNLKKYYWKKA
jgi:hypothetical protein